MFQNFHYREIYFGFLSFLNPVSKTLGVSLTYEELKIFVFLEFLLLILTKYFGVIMDETLTIIIIIIIIIILVTFHCHCY